MLEALQGIDTQLLLFVNSFHNLYWDNFMWYFSGKITWIPLYISIFYVLLRNFKPRTAIFMGLFFGLTILIADQICSSVIRPYFERFRPANLNNPISEFIHIVNEKRGGRYGFPSCHSANTFGLAFFALFLLRNKATSISLFCWALVTCYSRMYLGLHYPGDLLAGAFVGLFGAFIAYYLFTFLSNCKFIQDQGIKTDRLRKDRCNLIAMNAIPYIGIATTGVIAILSFFNLIID